MRDELGGDAGLARAAEAAVKVPAPTWRQMVATAFQRVPRMVSATWSNYLEAGAGERLVLLVLVAIFLGMATVDAIFAANTIWRLVTLPRNWLASKGRDAPFGNADKFAQFFGDIKLFEIVMGVAGFLLVSALLVLVLLQAEGLLTRKGNFGGGGAEMAWPAAPAK